jgi:hypothetical protein
VTTSGDTTGPHIRIGIDTGGTFTDVVAVDTRTGRIATTKTPSTPTNPADGFLTGIDKILGLIGARPDEVESVLHGTTVATNQLLQGKVGALGFITTTGYESMLEIARQSVPDGYGNSYFWVKPDRIVPADRVCTVGGRLDFKGNELTPFDRESAVAAVRFFKSRGISAFLRERHARAAAGRSDRRRIPSGGGVAVLAGAAGVPRIRAGDDDPGRRRGETHRRRLRLGNRPTAWRARRDEANSVLHHAVERGRAVG